MSSLVDSLNKSQLSLKGETPQQGVNAPNLTIPLNPDSLKKSQLDIDDGATPSKYLDNPPK
jgi:hypothetical protein